MSLDAKKVIQDFGSVVIMLVGNHAIIDGNHAIIEYDEHKTSSDKAAGHAEMAGFWELMAHYRELTNKKGAFKISEKELGLMRELNPNNQKDTMVMKLARKRFLEYTSAQKIFSASDSLIKINISVWSIF